MRKLGHILAFCFWGLFFFAYNYTYLYMMVSGSYLLYVAWTHKPPTNPLSPHVQQR